MDKFYHQHNEADFSSPEDAEGNKMTSWTVGEGVCNPSDRTASRVHRQRPQWEDSGDLEAQMAPT